MMWEMINNIVMYGAVLLTVGLVLLSFIEDEINKSKAKEAKRLQLIKVKAEIHAQNKKLQFEEYRKYIENKYNNVYIMNTQKEVDEYTQEVSLLEGVKQLRDNGHKYVPYVRSNPLDDIRSSLSEFTVSDVLSVFY